MKPESCSVFKCAAVWYLVLMTCTWPAGWLTQTPQKCETARPRARNAAWPSLTSSDVGTAGRARVTQDAQRWDEKKERCLTAVVQKHRRAGKCWRVRAEVCCSDVRKRGNSLAAREHGSVLLACWEPKQSWQVPPPLTWQSIARRSVRRLSVCPHTSPLWLARPPAVAGNTGGRVELCCHTQATGGITVSISALKMGSNHLIFIYIKKCPICIYMYIYIHGAPSNPHCFHHKQVKEVKINLNYFLLTSNICFKVWDIF